VNDIRTWTFATLPTVALALLDLVASSGQVADNGLPSNLGLGRPSSSYNYVCLPRAAKSNSGAQHTPGAVVRIAAVGMELPPRNGASHG